jgi:ribosomal protein S3AE
MSKRLFRRKNVSLPMADGAPAVLSMHFEVSIPEFKGDRWEETARAYYRMYAVALVEALAEHAPGALFDAVFGEMAYRKASPFRIPEKHVTDVVGG